MKFMPPYITEALQNHKLERKALNKQIQELDVQFRLTHVAMERIAREQLVLAGLPEGESIENLWFDLEHGWHCPDNVLEVCVYSDDECCIYCGQPDERK